MADQFPSGLGSEEMYSWLPPNSDHVFTSSNSNNHEHQQQLVNPSIFCPQSFNSIVDSQLLAQRLAACTLHQRTSRRFPPFPLHQPPSPSAFQPNLENFRAVGFKSFSSTHGGPDRECCFPTEEVRPAQSYLVPNPVQSQADSMMRRGRNFRKYTGWFLKSRIIEMRVLRVEGCGGGVGGGGMDWRGSTYGRGYGGTGVFLPDYATSTPLTSGPRKRPGTRTRQVNQVSINRCSLNKAHTRKEEECHLPLSPEAVLPQEWTY